MNIHDDFAYEVQLSGTAETRTEEFPTAGQSCKLIILTYSGYKRTPIGQQVSLLYCAVQLWDIREMGMNVPFVLACNLNPPPSPSHPSPPYPTRSFLLSYSLLTVAIEKGHQTLSFSSVPL